MIKKHQNNPISNRISLNIMTHQIGKEIMKDVPPDERHPIFLQKVELMIYREGFIKEVFELRDRFGVPKQGFNSFNTCIKWAEKITVETEIEYEDWLDILFKHFDVKPRWKNIIEYFILFDDIDAPYLLPRKASRCQKGERVQIYISQNKIK